MQQPSKMIKRQLSEIEQRNCNQTSSHYVVNEAKWQPNETAAQNSKKKHQNRINKHKAVTKNRRSKQGRWYADPKLLFMMFLMVKAATNDTVRRRRSFCGGDGSCDKGTVRNGQWVKRKLLQRQMGQAATEGSLKGKAASRGESSHVEVESQSTFKSNFLDFYFSIFCLDECKREGGTWAVKLHVANSPGSHIKEKRRLNESISAAQMLYVSEIFLLLSILCSSLSFDLSSEQLW